jgi:hypothetical protein
MKHKTVLAIALVLLGITIPVRAEQRSLGATFDATYMSRLMDKGGEYYGKQGGFLQGVNLDLWGTGLGVAVGHRAATSSGYQAKERYDYKVHYGRSLFADQAFETKTAAAWVYHHLPEGGAQFEDYYEVEVAFAWPKLVPGGWVPGYQFNGEHGLGTDISNADWWHLLSLRKEVDLEQLPNPLNLYADMAYRDGLGGIRAWTHATIGVSTEIAIASQVFVIPGIFHQFSMSDLLTKDDVTYAVISAQYRH